jgi:hypothetical protein
VAQRSLRDLELADVNEDVLRELIAEGETELVERKARIPDEGLGPTVASFANTAGGWVLLGVDNQGTVIGWAPKGRAEPQDWIRSKLREELDPLPGFAAKPMPLDGHDIVVVRVQASADKPCLVRKKGAVYIREPGGKQPISSQAALLALAKTREQAQHEAYTRLTTLPLVRAQIGPHHPGTAANEQTRVADWVVAASPLSIPAGFGQRALSEGVKRAVGEKVIDALRDLGPPANAGVQTQPDGSGYIFKGRNDANGNEAHLTLDAGGVVVGRFRFRVARGACHVGTIPDDILTPLLTLVMGALEDCRAVGKTHLHLHVFVRPTAQGWNPTLSLMTAHTGAEWRLPPTGAFFGGDLELPADADAIGAESESWMRQIARTAGIDWPEPEPSY